MEACGGGGLGLEAAGASGASGAPKEGGGALEKAGEGVSDIQAFLSLCGLGKYLQSFLDNGFDTMTAVRAMDEQDMREDIGMAEEDITLLLEKIAAGAIVPPRPPPSSEEPMDVTSQQMDPAGLISTAHDVSAMTGPAGMLGAMMPMGNLGETTAALLAGAMAPQDLAAQHQASLAALFGEQQRDGVVGGLPLGATPEALAGALQGMAMQLHSGFPGPVPGLTPQALAAMQGNNSTFSQENSLFALAQLAEEAAQMATSAQSFCANPQDMTQVAAVAEAAEQAAQRAQWAAKVVAEMCPPDETKVVLDGWLVTMREITKTAAEVAEDAFQVCKAHKEEIDKICPPPGERRSKVPCRHFLETGSCREGSTCRFSHDPKDQKPRPLVLKRQEECKFFAQGKCIRGAACAWAHGPEELEEITKYVSRLRDEKSQLRRSGRSQVYVR